MLPVIALIGRPNVGKSTLFNRLTHSRDALVADEPGLTRDRKYATVHLDPLRFIVIDTGGVGEEVSGLDAKVSEHSMLAADEADFVLFMVDAQAGLTAADLAVATLLRRSAKPVLVVANKNDDLDLSRQAEFFKLGLGEPIAVSAEHGRGVPHLLEVIVQRVPQAIVEHAPAEEHEKRIRVAVVGKPNVGKSTLINTLLGEERVLVYDIAGTTRDSTDIPFDRNAVGYTLIDTAGIRRKAKVTEKIEKFSVVKALQSIENAHVVIFLFDGQEGVSEQDASLLGFVLETGKALVVAANKTENFTRAQKQALQDQFERICRFVEFAPLQYISALHKKGIERIWHAVDEANRSARAQFSTPELTRFLQQAVEKHAPPMVRGRRIKLRYAHQGGQNPPTIVIHGNQTAAVPSAYQRYLQHFFLEVLHLHGTPVRVIFRGGENPFAGRKNTLTPRQEHRRRRLMQHVKSRK